MIRNMRNQIVSILSVIFLLAATTVYAQNDRFYEELESKGYSIVVVENDKVREYLDDVAYDKPELLKKYSYSIVSKYSKGGSSRPAGLQLTWESDTPGEDIEAVEVSLVELDDESGEWLFDGDMSGMHVKYYYPEVGSKEYLLCNMCPGKYCYYQIAEVLTNGLRNVLKRGRFYAEGQIRMLRVGGMYNVRDFGGWQTSFDREVVYGRLFRGNRPDVITETGKNDFVKNERITADLDLRGTSLTVSPMGPPREVEYYCTSNQRYKYALTGTGGPNAIAKDLGIIADVLGRGGSVFLHCNHGVNRAGSLSFVIEGILGYSEADLCRDYELSSFAYGSVARGQNIADMFTIIRSYGQPGDDLAQCFYNFARSIGVSEETLDTIRSEMLGLYINDPLITQAHRE